MPRQGRIDKSCLRPTDRRVCCSRSPFFAVPGIPIKSARVLRERGRRRRVPSGHSVGRERAHLGRADSWQTGELRRRNLHKGAQCFCGPLRARVQLLCPCSRRAGSKREPLPARSVSSSIALHFLPESFAPVFSSPDVSTKRLPDYAACRESGSGRLIAVGKVERRSEVAEEGEQTRVGRSGYSAVAGESETLWGEPAPFCRGVVMWSGGQSFCRMLLSRRHCLSA